MQKSILIPYDLFVDLVRYHLIGTDDMDDLSYCDLAERIHAGLMRKLEAGARRDSYTRSKTAATPEEREAARQEYLDRAGIFPDWRWGPGGPDN